MHAFDVGFAKAGGPSSGSLTTVTSAGSDQHNNSETYQFAEEGKETIWELQLKK